MLCEWLLLLLSIPLYHLSINENSEAVSVRETREQKRTDENSMWNFGECFFDRFECKPHAFFSIRVWLHYVMVLDDGLFLPVFCSHCWSRDRFFHSFFVFSFANQTFMVFGKFPKNKIIKSTMWSANGLSGKTTKINTHQSINRTAAAVAPKMFVTAAYGMLNARSKFDPTQLWMLFSIPVRMAR